jgi:MFS transporter, OFA family, oxalate/formate antiporter
MSSPQIKNRGWTVTLAGTGINLALGILYTWSIFKGAILDSIDAGGPFNWDKASVNDPYAVCCLVFAFSMILAGKVQDKFGPKITCVIGGLLVGLGFIWVSQTSAYSAWIIGFGVLVGMGIGFGYSAATPPALKWFPPAKTGLIAGIVVSGFGLASVYIAPLARYLLGAYGLQQAMLFFGIAFAIVVSTLGMLISNPPAGFVADPAAAQNAAGQKTPVTVDCSPSELFKQGKFYVLWLCYFIGAGAGLMVIGSAKGLAQASMGEMAFLIVAIMAVGNAAGRLVAGVVSDKIGRANTLVIMLLFQAVLMFAAVPGLLSEDANPVVVVLLVTFMLFNYGTNLALFPAFTKDFWGLKNFGMNYGIIFSAWGIGAFVLVRASEMIKVATGSFATPFIASGVLLLIGTALAFTLRPKKVEAVVHVPVGAESPAIMQEELEELAKKKSD